MAKINITPDEFGDVVVAFLFDKLLHKEDVSPNNENFNKFIDNLDKRSGKSLLRDAFLSMDPDMRLKYKRIKDVFEGLDETQTVISIKPKKEVAKKAKKKRSIIKSLIKKLIGANTEVSDNDLDLLIEEMKKEIEE